MKVLIVDDQLVSRKKIEKIMQGFCDTDSVDCGQAALDSYRRSLEGEIPYDLITLDVSMPDMDGRQVLQQIRALEVEHGITSQRQVKVLMITSSSDKYTVVSSIQAGCDDYLVKPLNRETIAAKLKKFGLMVDPKNASETTVHEMINMTITRFKNGKLDLPTMPHIVREIQGEIDQAEPSVFKVAAIIENDVSMAVKLIATANSPLYRGVEKVYSVYAAISRLGLKEIQEIVAAIANKSLYATKLRQLKQLLDQLWLHSLACANAAKLLSEKLGRSDGETLFMGGLIHDIGSVLLLKSLGDVMTSVTALDTAELISSVYEVHSNFGGMLLENWSFNQEFVNICKQHEWEQFPPETDEKILIVNLADHLAHMLDYGFFPKDPQESATLCSARMLGLDSETLAEVGRTVVDIMASSDNSF